MAKAKLTPKQQRVHDLLVAGKDAEEAAKVMGISVNGIYQHKRRIEEAGYKIGGLGSRRGRRSPRARTGQAITSRPKADAPKRSGIKGEPTLLDARPDDALSVEDHVSRELATVTGRIAHVEGRVEALTFEISELAERRQRLEDASLALKVTTVPGTGTAS
jgi:hypothetical protein